MTRPNLKIPLPVLVGPTAVGKTALAVALAEYISDLLVISADSRQIYRYMDIGTAKPTAEERRRAPHEFIDIRNPDEPYSAGTFGREAREVIAARLKQGYVPLVVGGSGLYIRALVDGLFEGEVSDPAVRERLREEARSVGLEVLYRRLQAQDPESAQKIHPNDEQRILRALELMELTGEPRSIFLKKKKQTSPYSPIFVGLTMERQALYRRIEIRVGQMLAAGLVDEVERLRRLGYGPQLQALQTVGYKEIFAFLEGQLSLTEAVDLIKRNTRRFAKRQLTWFRADPRIEWIEIDADTDFDALARKVAKLITHLGSEVKIV